MFAKLAEIGGPLTHNNYPWGWTMAGNTPFRRWKREVHEGGVADPCIVSWARGSLDGGAIRGQFTHAIDVAPTLLELAGIDCPAEIDGVAQTAVDGVSFGYLLGAGGERAAERHTTQYFEMFGSRAIYQSGWKAVTFHPVGPLYDDQDPNAPFGADVWELYHVAEDLSETRDLAAQRPELLAGSSTCGGRRRSATRCCRSTTGCCGPWCTPSPITGRRARCSVTSPVRPRCRSRSR